MTDRAVPVGLGPRAVDERPLTPLQRQIWTSQRLEPDAPLANMGILHRIAGTIEPQRFVAAFDTVVAASDALRSVVADGDGDRPVARILATPPAGTEIVELAAGDLDRWCRERIATPLDITRCGYDSVLLRHSDGDWSWWLDLHHLVTDAWGSALVFAAVADIYGRRDGCGTDTFDRLVQFGEVDHPGADLADDTTVRANTPIAPYGPRGRRTTSVTQTSIDPGALAAVLPDEYRTLSPELSRLCVLATATAVLLHRLDGRNIVDLGVPLHFRSGRARPHVIGPLMELQPVTVDLQPDDSFGSVFDRVRRAMFDVMRDAVPGVAVARGYDAVVNVLTARFGDFAGLPTTIEWWRSGHVESAHPIRVHAHDLDGRGLHLDVEINDGLSADGAHRRFGAHLQRVLSAALGDPDRSIETIGLVTSDEQALLDGLNPAAPDVFDARRPAHEVIAAQLRLEPGRVTAEHDGEELTAGELDRRAGTFARWLVGQGVATGDRVGLQMPRSTDVLVAVHGVLRAGAAFVMLDPDDPPARRREIVDDAGTVLELDRLPALGADSAADDPLPVVDPDDLAYVLYTSGSTGRPKGVPISHRGLAGYLAFAADAYATTGPMVMPLHSNLAVDLTITSLFLPQLAGGRTVVVSGEPLEALAAIAADRRITVLKATPSQLDLLRRMYDAPTGLEVVIVGGEAFRTAQAEAFARHCPPEVRIVNEYGPTEAVVGCMVHVWDRTADLGPDVPIGRACPDAEVFVLDPNGLPTPVGAWGELYVRRPGMSTGYLHLPELSAERFVTIDGVGSGPLYRTGDRVRIERDVLVFGGRIDEQLNVDGMRVEPGEIEAALLSHPRVGNAIVRVWTPVERAVERCVRCGLGTDVPDVSVDSTGVCSVCRDFDRIEVSTRDWFRTPTDLDATLERVRGRATGGIDCLHLLSGGKDSTYALYQLVERGWRVHALTLDNGFISDGAKENIRRTVADLGVTHEFVTTDAMNEIFRDSLDRFSNVCNGCYKTIYTLATARAHELGIPVVVTGLSRGQFFETRLVPHQFDGDHVDVEAIDRTVLAARRAYHRTSDAVTRLVPEQAVFDRTDVDVLAEIEYVDFYRYVDVSLAEMYEFLSERAPWVRPDDTGRSTNCLINVAGIHVHRTERGFHNYAIPYSWDVRLGHKTREEALDELDDEVDPDEIGRLLAAVGYEPRTRRMLTAWYQAVDGRPIDPGELRSHLLDLLPARSVPRAFVHVDDLPLASSTKLDIGALPPPATIKRGSAASSPPVTATEAVCADVWMRVLGVERVGLDDDFFDLGGASLAALETVAAIEQRFDVDLPDALVFRHRRLDDFAAAVDAARSDDTSSAAAVPPVAADHPPPLSAGQEAMLFEQRAAPHDTRYNVTRLYTIEAPVASAVLRRAFEQIVARHEPLHTAFDADRSPLALDEALSFETFAPGCDPADVASQQRQRPFDLERGPLVRVHAGELEPGRTHVLISLHHLTIDAGTFDLLWAELDALAHQRDVEELVTTYGAHASWQRGVHERSRSFWAERLRDSPLGASQQLQLMAPMVPEADGYLEIDGPVTMTELTASATTTPFVAALGAIAVVAGTGGSGSSAEVTVTVTVSTKDHPDAEPLIGYFLNTLPVVVEAPADVDVATVDAAAGRAMTEILPHRTFPYAEIVTMARSLGLSEPGGSFMLAYERLAPASFGPHAADHRILASGTAVVDATFFVHERGDELRLGVEYRGATVGEHAARRLLALFSEAIAARCRAPATTVGELRSRWGALDLVGPPLPSTDQTVLQAIVQRATTESEATAVIDAAGNSLSYAELVGRAAAIATRVQELVDHPRRVGIAVGRSALMIEAILGAQLAGASYVPLDPELTSARRAEVVDAADLDVILVDDDVTTMGGPYAGVHVIDVRDRHEPPAPTPAVDDLPRADQPAYVVFTSGTTGTPAGISVTHRQLAASTAARAVFYGRAPERFLLTSSIGFDSSMVGLWWTLSSGGAVVVPSEVDVHDVDRLASLVRVRSVTHVLMVPSLYRAVLARQPGSLGTLRTVIVAGEACPAELVVEHHRLLPTAELVNEYGPSEATVWATAHRCEIGDDPVPIGRPVAGVTVRVADADLRPVPERVAGELLISGPGVVDGYVTGGRDLAAFVDDGVHRWYRTGDRVAVDDLGRLRFLGRIDDQLNVGGVRLEPDELEAHLVRIDGIEEAAVVAVDLDGRASIVAHVVGDPDRADVVTVRSDLDGVVAPGMMPQRLVFHDRLPRTARGKLDRRTVQTWSVHAPVDTTGPSTDALTEIWRRALRRPDLDPDADFFAAGGDSLAAVEIVTAVGELVGRDIPVSALLTAPTPATMARREGVRPVNAVLDGAVEAADDGIRLVTLRSGVEGGPTVLMTAVWDDVQSYRALADAFPTDVHVTALAVVDSSVDGRLQRVPDLVDVAIGAVVGRLADRGPIVVLGWSVGGMVAYEMGQRLAASGLDVCEIGLIDTFFPGEDRHRWSNRWWKYKSMMRPGGFGIAAREFGDLFARRLRRYAARFGRALLAWGGETVERRDVDTTKAGVPFSAFDHRPAPGPASVVVYAADTTNPKRTVDAWRQVAPDLRVVPIAGRHRGYRSIMGADRVGTIVDDVIASAFSESGAAPS